MEKWKDVTRYEGMYQISDKGRVKSLPRIVFRTNGYKYTIIERFLKPRVDHSGYLLVNLSRDGGKETMKIHQMVAIHFLNHIPCGCKIVVDHIDHDPLNNRLDNLQLISPRENTVRGKRTVGGTSKYVGVSWCSRDSNWQSHIMINGKANRLGNFTGELDAANAYQTALAAL